MVCVGHRLQCKYWLALYQPKRGHGCVKWNQLYKFCRYVQRSWSKDTVANTLILLRKFINHCWCGNTVTFDPEWCTYRLWHIQLIALHFEHPWPCCRKFMVGMVSQFTLQPILWPTQIPLWGGGGGGHGNSCKSQLRVLCSLSHWESMMSTENDDGEH